MKKTICCVLLLLIYTCLALAKQRPWQEGLLLDTFIGEVPSKGSLVSGSVTVYAGSSTVRNPDGTKQSGGSYHGTDVAVGAGTPQSTFRAYQDYVVELGDLVYTARENFSGNPKPAPVTVNQPIKVFIEKDTLYLLDEAKKEHRAGIIKKIRKPAP